MARSSTSYQKGQSGNKSGRPRGTPNKITGTVREGIETIIHKNRGKFEDELSKLQGYTFCKVYLELLPYIAPKHRAIDLSFDFERLTESEIDTIIMRLKNSLKDE